MANDFRIVISGAVLDKKAYQDIVRDLKKFGDIVKIPIQIDDKNLNKTLKNLNYITDASGNITKGVQTYNVGLGQTLQITSKLNKETKQLEIVSSKVTRNQEKAIREQEKAIREAEKRNKQFFDSFTNHANKSAQQSASAFKQAFKEIEYAQKQAIERNKQFNSWFMPQMSNKSARESAFVFEPISKEISQIKNQQFESWFIPSLDKTTNSAKQSAVAFEDLFRRAEKSRKGLSSLEQQVASLNPVIQGAGKSSITFGDAIGIAIERTVEWATAMTIFYGSLRQLQNGISYIIQMDTAMTDLSKVVDFSTSELEEMSREALRLGKELSKSSVEIMKGMAEFGRITKNKEEIIELTRVATMASNVTEMTADTAAKALTSTMVTFGLQAKDAMMILDSWNELQNNFRVSAEDLADAIGKVGAASKIAKTDMQTLEGEITAIIQATGITGSEAGTAVKSFISRMFRTDESDIEELGKTAKVLKDIANIDIESNGQLKGFGEIIGEIASKWKDLTEQQKLALAQQIGATYHYSKFIALMDNYKIAVDATTKAYNSQNSAIEENKKRIESIEGKIKNFTVTLENMWKNTIDSNTIKFIVDLGTKLVELIDKFGLLASAVAVANVALIAFGKMEKLNVFIKGLSKSISTLTLSTITLRSVLLTLWPLLAVGAVVALTKAFDHFYVTAEEQRQKVSKLTSEFEQLKTQAEQLRNIESPSESQIEHLALLERELYLREKILNLEKQEQIEKDIKVSAFGGTLANNIQSYESALGRITASQKKLKEELVGLNDKADSQKIVELSTRIRELGEEANEVEVELLGAKKTLTEYLDSMDSNSPPKLKEELERLVKKIDEQIIKAQEAGNAIDNNTKSQKENADAIKTTDERLNDVLSTYKEYSSTNQELSDIYQKLANGQQLSADKILRLIENHKELQSALEVENGQLTLNKDAVYNLLQAKNKEAKENIENQKKKLQAHQENLKAILDLNKKEIKSVQLLNKEQLKLIRTTQARFKGTGLTPMAAGDLLYNELYGDLSDTEESLAIIDALQKSIGGGSGSKSGSNFKSSSASSSVSEALIERDRYAQLNYELEKTNVLLEKNKALQENADEYKKIKLLDEEIALLKQKQNNLHAINEERRKERAELVEKLSSQGAKFAGEGDSLSILNAQILLEQKIAQVNAHRNDKNKTYYNQLKSQYDDLANAVKRFIELQTKDIPDASIEWYSLQKAINETQSSLEEIAETAISSYQNYLIKRIEKQIDKIEEQKKKSKEASEERIAQIQEEIDALEKENDEIKKQEERERRLLEIQKQRDLLENIKKERNVRIFTGGEWKWVADPRALREAQERLTEMETEFTQWDEEQQRQARINSLKEEIDTIKKNAEEEEKAYDKRIEKLRDFVDRSKEKLEEQKTEITSWTDLMQSLSGIEEEVYAERLDILKDFVNDWNKIANKMDLPGVDISSNNSTSSKVVKAGADGKAPKGLSAGTIVQTNGGDYLITDVNDDGSYKSTKIYDKGGKLNSGQTAINLSGKPERILSPQQTKSFDKLVNILPNITRIFDKVSLPKFDSIQKSMSNDNSIHIHGDIIVRANNPNEFWQQFNKQLGNIVSVKG